MKNIFKKNRGLFGVSIVLSIISMILIACGSLFEQRLIDNILLKDAQLIRHAAIVYLLYSVVSACSYLLVNLVKSKAIVKMLNDIRLAIMDRLMRSNIANFRMHNSSEYSSELINDIGTLKTRYFNMLYLTVISVIAIVSSFGIQLYYYPTAAVVSLICCALITILPILLGGLMGGIEKKKSEALAHFTTFADELFGGFEIIFSFGVRHIYQKRYEQEIAALTKAEYNSEKMSGTSEALAQVLSAVIQGIMFVYIGYLTYQGNISMGTFFVFSSMNLTMNSNMTMLLQSIPLMLSAKPIIEKLLPKEAPEEQTDKADAKFDSRISMKNVNVVYDAKPVYENGISWEIEKGKKYALVGKSGSGKTTLINAMMGNIADYSGEIFYDNVSLKDIDPNSVSKMIAYVQQNVFMFDDSIRNNICLYEQFSDAALDEVIEKVGLTALVGEKGLDYGVGENGNHLSGGQKQKVALARALIRGRDTIILDEGTSALDEESSQEIEDMLLHTDGITMIVISHHLRKQEQYDSIMSVA